MGSENGGTVRYDYEYDGLEIIEDAQPTAPKWLLDMLGDDYFNTVIWVWVSVLGVLHLLPLKFLLIFQPVATIAATNRRCMERTFCLFVKPFLLFRSPDFVVATIATFESDIYVESLG